ncbi:MAG TPA: tetratricopeptide repeat protein, partial [Verrucomicrobiae bacterium]|nr:tetratricopeptide repeat protein [Verrucomicrobiae bacterium]
MLAAMVWVVFGQTLGHEFLGYDDGAYVYENPEVSRGFSLRGVAWAFTYAGIGHWHPVTWLSHMLDCEIYGLKPWGHHLDNVLLHAAAAILLFLVLRGMTGAQWRSAFVAALFAIHPLRAESVAWVAERKDVLSGVFFMLTLGIYVRYARGPRSPARFAPVAALFAIGLMCKGMLVTLPFVLLLLDWWPLCRLRVETGDGTDSKPLPPREIRASIISLVVEKIPLFALSAASCVITSLAPEDPTEVPHYSAIGNAAMSCVIYLRQMFYPAGLAIPYPYPPNGWPMPDIVLALALLTAISIVAAKSWKRRPWLAVGWFWYLGMLVPVMGIVQISYYSHADRYTYLPQIGLYVLLTWAVAGLSANLPHRRLALGGGAAVVLAALMFCARAQTAFWKNDHTLWIRALDVTTDNDVACNNLGNDFLDEGNLDAAIGDFHKALQINPRYAKAHYNLGVALERTGQTGKAIEEYQAALQIMPNMPGAHNNLGNALFAAGDANGAVGHYLLAIQYKPDFAEAHNNLGNVLLLAGRFGEAIDHYQKALDINPDYAEAHNDLGNALLQTGHAAEAGDHFRRALELNPKYAQAH